MYIIKLVSIFPYPTTAYNVFLLRYNFHRIKDLQTYCGTFSCVMPIYCNKIWIDIFFVYLLFYRIYIIYNIKIFRSMRDRKKSRLPRRRNRCAEGRSDKTLGLSGGFPPEECPTKRLVSVTKAKYLFRYLTRAIKFKL